MGNPFHSSLKFRARESGDFSPSHWTSCTICIWLHIDFIWTHLVLISSCLSRIIGDSYIYCKRYRELESLPSRDGSKRCVAGLLQYAFWWNIWCERTRRSFDGENLCWALKDIGLSSLSLSLSFFFLSFFFFFRRVRPFFLCVESFRSVLGWNEDITLINIV